MVVHYAVKVYCDHRLSPSYVRRMTLYTDTGGVDGQSKVGISAELVSVMYGKRHARADRGYKLAPTNRRTS